MDRHHRLLKKQNDLSHDDLFRQLLQRISILAHYALGGLHLFGKRGIISCKFDPVLLFRQRRGCLLFLRAVVPGSLWVKSPDGVADRCDLQDAHPFPPYLP